MHLSLATSRLGFSPLPSITHISSLRWVPLTKAIFDPSRETEASRPSSISLRGDPPMIEICHRLEEAFGPSTQLATKWVPSGYHASGTAANPGGGQRKSFAAINLPHVHTR